MREKIWTCNILVVSEMGGLRWGDQCYSFPILGGNPQEAEAFTQDHKNQSQMFPAGWGDNVRTKWKIFQD